MNLKNIYINSPYFIKQLLVNIKAYLNNKKRYSKTYEIISKELDDNLYKTYDEIKEYQKLKLKKLLLECFDFSVYYNNLFIERNIDKEVIDKDPIIVLNAMPFLEKQDRKERVDDIINTNSLRKATTVTYTSGTTGTPTKNYLDNDSQAIIFAIWARFHRMNGINKKDKHIRFSSNLVVNPNTKKQPYWIYNKIDNQLLMSVFHLKNENLLSYVKKIIEFSPRYIDGFPSAIYIIAKYINDHNIKLNVKLDGICTTAETLYENQRYEIEKAFKCKVFNQYASSEGSPFITECKHGKMHLLEDTGVFEILNENNEECKPGELGRLVVTSFTNWKTPLIRYNILDYALKSKDEIKCKCGSEFKYVDSIQGRSNDMLWTYEKGYISGGIASAIKDIEGINKTQIIQSTPKNILIKIVRTENYKKSNEDKIILELKKRMGNNISIDFEYVEDIENAVSGKSKLLIRNFNIADYEK